MKRPRTILITGGSCAGKTTGIVRLRERLLNLGWHPVIVPEAATLIFSGAGRPDNLNRELILKYQRAILTTQLQLEDTFAALATDPKSVLITDRGALDSKAFLSPEEWQVLLHDLNLNEVKLRDERYDAIIHMVTTADGAREAYKLEGVRNETPEEAVIQDKRLQVAYLGHGHQKIIDNRGDFTEKLHRVEEEVCNFLGLPDPFELERKFKLASMPKLPSETVISLIEQTYLVSKDGDERRLRKRTQDGTSIYTLGRKRFISPGKRIEKEEGIRGSEYLAYMAKERDLSRQTIRKMRHCFLHNNRCLELDVYQNPMPGMIVLEIEVSNLTDQIILPSWANDAVEVTSDSTYSNFQLALHNSQSN